VEQSDPNWRVGAGFEPGSNQLVVDGAGRAVWASFVRDSQGDEQMAVYERCGTPAAWQQRLLGVPAGELFPGGIAGNAGGDVLAVWEVSNGGGSTTFFSASRTAGGAWGAPQEIVTGQLSKVEIAMGGNGDAVAAWDQLGPSAIRASIRPSGGDWGAPATLKSATQAVEAAMSATGDTVVLTNTGSVVEAYYRPAGGSFGAAQQVETLPFATTVDQLVEFDGNGRPVAVFGQQGTLYAAVRSGGSWQATADVLDDTGGGFVDPQRLARHPSGLAAVWTRRTGNVPNDDLGVSRLGAGGWEAKKLFDMANRFATVTTAANTDGEVLVAGNLNHGSAPELSDVWGTVVPSLAAPWPASLDLLSTADTGTLEYRDPIAAGGGSTFVLGWAVHGASTDYSEAIATTSAPPCGGSGPNPGPNPSPVPPGGSSPPAFGAQILVTLGLAADRIPARAPLPVVVANANGFAVAGVLSGETVKALAARRRKRRLSLKPKQFTLDPGARKVVKLRLPKKLRRVLKRKGKVALRLRAKVRDPAGNTRTVAKRATIRLKKPR
jgi:hypothetical protein